MKDHEVKTDPPGRLIREICPNSACQGIKDVDRFGHDVSQDTLLQFVSDEYKSSSWFLGSKIYVCTLECPKCGFMQKYEKKGDNFFKIY